MSEVGNVSKRNSFRYAKQEDQFCQFRRHPFIMTPRFEWKEWSEMRSYQTGISTERSVLVANSSMISQLISSDLCDSQGKHSRADSAAWEVQRLILLTIYNAKARGWRSNRLKWVCSARTAPAETRSVASGREQKYSSYAQGPNKIDWVR